jgi:hypothetical protein
MDDLRRRWRGYRFADEKQRRASRHVKRKLPTGTCVPFRDSVSESLAVRPKFGEASG